MIVASAAGHSHLTALRDPKRERAEDRGDESDSRIERGFEIAPVPLRLEGKNRALVGLGSYLVNLGGCNDCHDTGPCSIRARRKPLLRPAELKDRDIRAIYEYLRASEVTIQARACMGAFRPNRQTAASRRQVGERSPLLGYRVLRQGADIRPFLLSKIKDLRIAAVEMRREARGVDGGLGNLGTFWAIWRRT
jgi:hypothetical protein